MAVARVAASSPQQFADQSSITFAFAAGSGATKVVVDVGGYNSLNFVTGVTYNGVSMTGVGGSSSSGVYFLKAKSFYLDSPPTGSVNVVVTFSLGSGNYGTCGATSYSGTATGVGAVTEATASSGTTASVTQSSSTSGNVVHAALACSYQATTVTAGKTENFTGASGVTWKGGSEYTAAGGSKTMDWTLSSTAEWICQCFEITASVSTASTGGTTAMMGA